MLPALSRGPVTSRGTRRQRATLRSPAHLHAHGDDVELAQARQRVAGDPDQVLTKLEEELKELDEARKQGLKDEVEYEVGDVLFVLVNLARLLKVDAEQSLRGTNAKFRGRFGYLERKLAVQGKSLDQATLAEMDSLWEEAKNRP